MTKPVYNFDPATLVFTGLGMADVDPMDPQNLLLPAFCTLVPVPEEIPQNHVAVFDQTALAWSVVEIVVPEAPGAPAPAPAPTLEELKASAQAALDATFEILYTQAVPNPAIANEYVSAYQSANAWLAGGMTGPAPLRVTAMAESMAAGSGAEVTEQEAAEFVVMKWLEAESVLDQRGAARLRGKLAVRSATTLEGVAEALEAGKVAMSSVGYTI